MHGKIQTFENILEQIFLKGSLTKGFYEEYADRLEVIEEGLAQAKQVLSEKPLREGKQNKNLPDLVRKVC